MSSNSNALSQTEKIADVVLVRVAESAAAMHRRLEQNLAVNVHSVLVGVLVEANFEQAARL